MEMRYFWLLDQYTQQNFDFQHHPGQENLADYPSKYHTGTGHQHVRPYYLHMKESPTHLPRALAPSARRGCAEILNDPYYRGIPLPRIQSRARVTNASAPDKLPFAPVQTAASVRFNERTPRTAGVQLTRLLPTYYAHAFAPYSFAT